MSERGTQQSNIPAWMVQPMLRVRAATTAATNAAGKRGLKLSIRCAGAKRPCDTMAQNTAGIVCVRADIARMRARIQT